MPRKKKKKKDPAVTAMCLYKSQRLLSLVIIPLCRKKPNEVWGEGFWV